MFVLPKHLENYGGGGFITSHLQGKTIDCALKDGTWLILKTTCGHEYRIGFQDIHGNQLKGEPFVENLDVTVVLIGAGVGATAGNVG